ncbi:MAG: 30S ribosomal protein S6 [Patescibacteria group bacterium]|nr:30S ribosomal protein S6 [Patescibacteria group bacterium]
MTEDNKKVSVYELGYLIVSTIPEEGVAAEVESIRGIINNLGGSMIAEETARRTRLAYEMRKKTVSGAYNKYGDGYFGWFKFDLEAEKADQLKKAVEVMPSILRVLIVTTVRENTYLGKRSVGSSEVIVPEEFLGGNSEAKPEENKEPVAPATIEEMDKSIDEMVKEAV